ncbi:hypothetical protein LC1Hm_0072 [Halomicrobium sp. LC1Hm]|nr:hypothetical protein LC1Hm_0072 [Halomicrobium sp. LC1Hm]
MGNDRRRIALRRASRAVRSTVSVAHTVVYRSRSRGDRDAIVVPVWGVNHHRNRTFVNPIYDSSAIQQHIPYFC